VRWVPRKLYCRWVLASRRKIPQYSQFHCVRRTFVITSSVPWVVGDFLEKGKISLRITFRSPSCTISLMKNAALVTRTTKREVSILEWIVPFLSRKLTHATWVLFLLYMLNSYKYRTYSSHIKKSFLYCQIIYFRGSSLGRFSYRCKIFSIQKLSSLLNCVDVGRAAMCQDWKYQYFFHNYVISWDFVQPIHLKASNWYFSTLTQLYCEANFCNFEGNTQTTFTLNSDMITTITHAHEKLHTSQININHTHEF
jgi:hypothetical protein